MLKIDFSEQFLFGVHISIHVKLLIITYYLCAIKKKIKGI